LVGVWRVRVVAMFTNTQNTFDHQTIAPQGECFVDGRDNRKAMFSGKVMNRVTVFELVGIQRHQLQIGTFPAIMSPALKNFGHQHVGVGTLKIPGHDRRYRQFPPGRIGPRQLWRNRSCADCQTGLQPLPTGVAETLHQFHGSISHRLLLLGIWSS
jgi:hypothetical protein